MQRSCIGGADLRVGGCAEAPAVAPIIRGRPGLLGNDSPDAVDTVAPPREGFPLLARPAPGARSKTLKAWAAAARDLIDARLEQVGAILLRGLPIGSPAAFSEFFHALGYEPMQYVGVATRDEVAPRVFTTNVSQPGKTIMLHNEMAAERLLPAHLFLYCDAAPPDGAGGETPIARNADWIEEFGPEIVERFVRRGFHRKLSTPSRAHARRPGEGWEDRYGTEDRRAVEAACARDGDCASWESDGRLIRRRFLDPLPEWGGRSVWWPTLANARPATSMDACYGDGELVEPEILERTRTSQWKIAVAFSWRRGDVLCLDNVGCQHGRLSFDEGVDRRVYVSIATPVPGAVRTQPWRERADASSLASGRRTQDGERGR